MRRAAYAIMIGGVCLALSSDVLAQRPARVATHVDSLRAARDGKPVYVEVLFTFASGKQVRGYVDSYTTCLLDRVECYELPPDRLPKPPLKAIGIERLKQMTVDGHTLEALYMKGKPLKILAENLAAPGPMQIFGYSKTKNDILIPIPLPIGGAVFISTGTHDKYYWYVRTNGGELQELPRSQKEFVKRMSELCSKAPALVAELHPVPGTDADRKPHYRVDNAPELVSKYNVAVARP